MNLENLHVDTLVIGGGIAGMQAALDLADQGVKVALVEREPSIGGKMITLSKVFPTLDCCSCITTPKMSAVAHHPNIQLFTYCDLQSVEETGSVFRAAVVQKPRYVDTRKCTGCRECEYACPITVPSLFDRGLGAYRAIRVPFSTAVPQKAVLDMDNCILCGKCETVCPANAVDFTQQPEPFEIETISIIAASGFELTPLGAKKEYGSGKLRNVIDPLMMERLLAPTGPYGRVLAACGEEARARRVLEEAYTLLMERANKIGDEALRRSFLENVPAHREVMRAWEANLCEDKSAGA